TPDPVQSKVSESEPKNYSTPPTEPAPEKTPEPQAKTTTPPPLSEKKPGKLGLKKTSADTKTLVSLDDLYEEIEADQTDESNLKTLAEISEETLLAAWEAYIDSVTQMTTKSILKNAGIKKSDGQIVVSVGSALAENTIRQQSDMVEFLKEKLGVSKLLLTVKVDPELAAQNEPPPRPKIMTDSEKYWKMKERNPLVEDMRKRFDLKLDQD
ncbi:MAG: hypothetical protein D6714_14500, partial [Bacteroidetes bacterium]